MYVLLLAKVMDLSYLDDKKPLGKSVTRVNEENTHVLLLLLPVIYSVLQHFDCVEVFVRWESQ